MTDDRFTSRERRGITLLLIIVAVTVGFMALRKGVWLPDNMAARGDSGVVGEVEVPAGDTMVNAGRSEPPARISRRPVGDKNGKARDRKPGKSRARAPRRSPLDEPVN